MGSLTNVVRTLERITESEFAGDFPKNRPINEIQDYLSRCETPSDVEQWLDDMACFRKDSGSADFQTLCDNVGGSLRNASNKAEFLRLWAVGKVALPSWVSPKRVLYAALADVLNAFKSFDIVATNSEMRVGRVMKVVRVYLRRVFGLTVILGSLAMPGDWFQEWGYQHRHTELEGFKFDTKDWYVRSQIADLTLRGVCAPLNKMPSLFLPANPTLQVYGDDGPNCVPILRKLQCYQDEISTPRISGSNRHSC